MKMGEWRYSSTFFTSAPDGGACSASQPSRFTPEETAQGAHCTRGWVDAMEKRKISYKFVSNVSPKRLLGCLRCPASPVGPVGIMTYKLEPRNSTHP
jgi:hypothetical protein